MRVVRRLVGAIVSLGCACTWGVYQGDAAPTIDPATGGTVTSADGEVTLTIPPNALSTPVQARLSYESAPSGPNAFVSGVYALTLTPTQPGVQVQVNHSLSLVFQLGGNTYNFPANEGYIVSTSAGTLPGGHAFGTLSAAQPPVGNSLDRLGPWGVAHVSQSVQTTTTACGGMDACNPCMRACCGGAMTTSPMSGTGVTAACYCEGPANVGDCMRSCVDTMNGGAL